MTPTEKFIAIAGPKYDAGQLKHGGTLNQRDCLAEMEQEIIDLWHYWQAHKLRGLLLAPDQIRDASLARWHEISTHPAYCDINEGYILALWNRLQALNQTKP